METQKGHIKQGARLDQVIEEGAVPQHAVGFNVKTTGVNTAKRQAASRARLTTVDNASYRVGVAVGGKGAPLGV
jgi:hypothetical protein